MSYRKVSTVCLVIDASVARAAGGIEGNHPVGKMCREFLMEVRGICHRMAWGDTLRVEWTRHASVFATEWLASMQNMKKLVSVEDCPDEQLQNVIGAAKDAGVVKLMEKDAHLLAAALASDGRIASRDDTVRGHFAAHLKGERKLASLVWVNPAEAADEAAEWLSRGAPRERFRQLQNHSP